MERLFILQGAPGVGKSTFVERSHLERWTVCPDVLRRLMTANRDVVSPDGALVEGWDNSHPTSSAAWKAATLSVANRMERGETVVLDSMAAHRRSLGRVLDLALRHRYQTVFVDLQDGLTVDEVLARNAGRNRVEPESVVRKAYARVRSFQYASDELRMTPGEMLASMDLTETEIDGGRYGRVLVVGDIQGCWSTFGRSVLRTLRDDDFLVFAGDLFDRGPADEAGPMFDWLMEHHGDEGKVFVRGNHDQYLLWYGDEDRGPGLPRRTRDTMEEILHGPSPSGLVSGSPKRLRRLARSAYADMRTTFPFVFGGRHVVVTHGGVHPGLLDWRKDRMTGLRSYAGLGWMSGETGWHGSGRFVNQGDYEVVGEDAVDIDRVIESYGEDDPSLDTIQMHGHRNEGRHTPSDFQHVFNLESRVESGGFLSVAVVESDGRIHVERFQSDSDTVDPGPPPDRIGMRPDLGDRR